MTLTHHHTGLASARFDTSKAVFRFRDWSLYLDETLGRWEVFVDAANSRAFTSAATWESLDGPSGVAFTDHYLGAPTGLYVMDTSPSGIYARAARAFAGDTGTDQPVSADRLTSLARQVTDLTTAAAGMDSASSALQRQVFAVRHAALCEELAVLEREADRVRSALRLASCALTGAPA